MKSTINNHLVIIFSCLFFTPLSLAQETFPTKPITIVNPNPPGGFVDNVGRNLSIVLQKILKQPVLIVNKPGANGAIGHAFVANTSADGYTLLLTSPSLITQLLLSATK